jgi:DNA polymerase III epsilon subunit-like protein
MSTGNCASLRDTLSRAVPGGFDKFYRAGRTDPEFPFWKWLPLPDFQLQGSFDMERFVKEIVEAFDVLATCRPIVDNFLLEHLRARPLVPTLRKALILDLETRGPGKPSEDEIVEVGLILVAYDGDSGGPSGQLDEYTRLRDPGPRSKAPPSGRITREMVTGIDLDKDRIEALIAQCDVIISHNAFGFDKPRFERLFPSAKSRPWLCSYRDLSWPNNDRDEANLPHLCEHFGINNTDPHRAMPDARALLQILFQKDGPVSYFARLIASGSEDARSSRQTAAVTSR